MLTCLKPKADDLAELLIVTKTHLRRLHPAEIASNSIQMDFDADEAEKSGVRQDGSLDQ